MANVKVAVRVRPLSKREEENDAVSVVNVHSETLLSITNWKIGGSDEGDRHRERVKYFSFDYVFNSSDKWDENYASQEKIYQQLGPEVISAACDGYNTCLFAYGQTSSGKTHTMVGTQDQVNCGLIPRISEGLFKSVTQLNADVTYKFEISFLEIYNEKVRDLLAPLGNTKFALKVREHAKDGPYVPDLSRHIVSDHQQVINLLEQGMICRTTASTHMHEFSSRSHAIFTIHFVQAKMEQQLPSEIVSKINLVDLAGSERANLNFSKDRLQEGANINKSLVMLGNCISALGGWPCDFAENALSAISMESLANDDTDLRSSQGFGSKSPGFVPYRNSVLTWLLKDSLGGNAKTIMIATISPASIHYNETMSTLRYARRATHIVNQPIINEDPHVRLIRELRGEIHRLKNLLCSASLGSSSASLCQDYSINQMLQENEVRVDQLTEAWVDKWKDVALIMQECNVGIRRQSVGVVVESDIPHLIGLDDDLSTGIVLYHLQNGCTRIGRDDALTTQDIVLNSTIDVESEHAVITNENDVVMFYPLGDAACTINGVDVKEPVQLKQGAVILLGKTNMFRFNHPAQAAQMREKRAIDKYGIAPVFQHRNVQALAAASHGGISPSGSTDGNSSPDDTEAVMEQMSLLLSPRSPHGLKEGHFFDSNEFDSFGEEEEVVDSEQCIMGDNQEELVEGQRLVVCGLKKEHALAVVKAEKELEEMERKVKEEKDKGALKIQQEIENFHQHKQTVSSSNGIADKSSFPTFVDLVSIQVKQADVECKNLMQRELILRHEERKAVANLGRKRAAIDVQRMSTELEIEEEEKRLQEMEMLICYTPPNERMSSVNSDCSSNGVKEKNKNSKEKSRGKESAKNISHGKSKDAPPGVENSRMSLSAKHKRSSSLSQKENTNKVLPNRTRSHSASVSSVKSSESRASEGKLQSNGNSKSNNNVFSRLYPQNKPKFDYLKKKDPIQYDDVAAKRSSQWERGRLVRREVSPLKGEIPPGKSNIEKQKLRHSYQPKSFENGLSVPPKKSKTAAPKKSGLSSTMPKTKSQSNPGLSKTMPGPKTDLNSKRKGSIPSKEKVEKKPFVTSRTSSLPDVSCPDIGISRLRVKRQSTPDLPKKILKKGEKKAAVWQEVEGSPQRLRPEMTRLRSASDVSTLSSTSSFPKETSGRRRCSTDMWTSVDLLPIRKSSSQAYFLPWNSERCVSLETLISDSMPQSMTCKPKSSSMVDLPRNTWENSEVTPVDEEEKVENESSNPELALLNVSKLNDQGSGIGEGFPTSEFPDDFIQDGGEVDIKETHSITSSSDISEQDSLEEDFIKEDEIDDASLLKDDERAKKDVVECEEVNLENGEKTLPLEQSNGSLLNDTTQLSPTDHLKRQNDGDMAPTPNNLEKGNMEHETDSVESSDDDLSSSDESVASDATYSLPASESRYHKEMHGEELSMNAHNTPFITLQDGILYAKDENPPLGEDQRVDNGEIMEAVDDDSDSAIGHCGVERNNILREVSCQTGPVDGIVFQEDNAQDHSNEDSSLLSASSDAGNTPFKLGLSVQDNATETLDGGSKVDVVLSEPSNGQQKTFCEAGCQTTPIGDESKESEDGVCDFSSKDAFKIPKEISPPSGHTDPKLVLSADNNETIEEGDGELGYEKRILIENSCQTCPPHNFGLNGTHDTPFPCDEPSCGDGGEAVQPVMWYDEPTEKISGYIMDDTDIVPAFSAMIKTVNEVACQTHQVDGIEYNGIDDSEPSDMKRNPNPMEWQSCNPNTDEVKGNDVLIYHENEKVPTLKEMYCQTLPIGSIHLNGFSGIQPRKNVEQEPCNIDGICVENDIMVEPIENVPTLKEICCQTLPFASVHLNGSGGIEPLKDVKQEPLKADGVCVENDQMVNPVEKVATLKEKCCQTLPVGSIYLNGISGKELWKDVKQDSCNADGLCVENDKMVEPVVMTSLNALPSISNESSLSSAGSKKEEEESGANELLERRSVNSGIDESGDNRTASPEVAIIPKDTYINGDYPKTCIEMKDNDDYKGDEELVGDSSNMVGAPPGQMKALPIGHERDTKDMVSQNNSLVPQSDEDGYTSPASLCSASDSPSSLSDHSLSDGNDQDPCLLSPTLLEISGGIPEVYLTNTLTSPKDGEKGENLEEEEDKEDEDEEDTLEGGYACHIEKPTYNFSVEHHSKEPNFHLEGEEVIANGFERELDATQDDTSSSESDMGMLYSILDSPEDKEGNEVENEVLETNPNGNIEHEMPEKPEEDSECETSEDSLYSLTYSPEEKDDHDKISEHDEEMLNSVSFRSVPLDDGNAQLGSSESESENDNQEYDRELEKLLRPDMEDEIQNIQKRGKVVTFCSPLVTVCEDVASQSESVSEADEIENIDSGDEECHEENGFEECKNSEDNFLVKSSEDNSDEPMVDGWESSVLGLEREDWEIFDDENSETGVEMNVMVDLRDEDGSKVANGTEGEAAKDLSSESGKEKLDRVNFSEADGVDQPPGVLQSLDEFSHIEDSRDDFSVCLAESVIISDSEGNSHVDPEKGSKLLTTPTDLPASFVSHHTSVYEYPKSSPKSPGYRGIDSESEHLKCTDEGKIDIGLDVSDGIGPLQDRPLDGEDHVLELGSDDDIMRNSVVDIDGCRDNGDEASLEEALLLDKDESDDEGESSVESEEIDVDLFKQNVMQVGVVFNQGKRYIIDGDEIFDPFALSPIKEEKDGLDLRSSLSTAAEDFYLPLSEEEGDVALYQRGKMEIDDVIMEPGFYSDESDDDGGMDHDNELPDEAVMDVEEGQWCPPRVEVALIKDVFTAEQDLPSDLVKSPEVENFLLQQEDCSDQDVTFGELAPHHSLPLHDFVMGESDTTTNTSSLESSKRRCKFLTPLNVDASPSTTTTNGHFGISPVAKYRKLQKVSFSPQQAQFSVASPCSSPESPQRKFLKGNFSRDSESDTDISEGETTASVRGAGDGRSRRNKPLEQFAKDIRKDLVTSSCAKLSKFMRFEENEVAVGQVYSEEEETEIESGVRLEGMVQSYMFDLQECSYSSEEESEYDQSGRLTQQKVKKNSNKGSYPCDVAGGMSRNKTLPAQQETGQTKSRVASYTQTSPSNSPGSAAILAGNGKIQRPSTLKLPPKKQSPSQKEVKRNEKPLLSHSPASKFRWDLFPSATTFQPPNLRRTQSLPSNFDNPLLVSPRKSSAETPSSDGGGGDLGLSLSSHEENSGDDSSSSDPFFHLIKSLEHSCQLPINNSSRVRELCDALQRSPLPELESFSSPVFQSEAIDRVFVSDNKVCQTAKESQSCQGTQTATEIDESANNSWWRQTTSSKLCANCQNSIQHGAISGDEEHTLSGGGDISEYPNGRDENLHQQKCSVKDERKNLTSPVFESIHKEAVSISCQEDLLRRVSALVDKPQNEQGHDPMSLQRRKNVTQPLINVANSSPDRQWRDLGEFANKLSSSQSRVRPVSQDVEELVPQKVQMPVFSDVSFDSEFAEHEFFSDEDGVSHIDQRVRERVKEDDGEEVEEHEKVGEDDDNVDPDLWDDVIEPELTVLMSNSTNTPVNQPSGHGTPSQMPEKITSDPRNSKNDIGRSEMLGRLSKFATDIPAHRMKDHSNDYVLSVNINIPPFPHRVEQHWNPQSYDANLQCNWSDAPEVVNDASNGSRGSEVLDDKGQDDLWMSHLRSTRTHGAQEGIVKGPKRFPSESSESQLTASSGVFTSSIQTNEVASSPAKLSDSHSPSDSVLAEDEDMINVQNELQDFLAKNVTSDHMVTSFYEGYERVQTSTPEGVGTQVGSPELEKSWASPELDALRSERQMVRRLSNSWDRSDLAVELMEARIMHGIGETDAFLRFLDNDAPLEEWLRTKNNLEMKHDEEKREILALEKSSSFKTECIGKIAKPSPVSFNGWSPKRRTPPSEHLKFLQGLRKDLVSNEPPSFADTRNEIEALLQEYKELHKNSESEIAQAQKELDGSRSTSRRPSATESGLQIDHGGSKGSRSDEDLIDKEIQSLHAASIAMSLSDSPSSDASSHRRFSFSGVSSDDDRNSDDAIRERRKYSRLNGDLSEPLKLVRTPSKKSLKEKLEDAERQVSSERQSRRSDEQCRQSVVIQSPGEWSECECSVLIGQTFQILLQETANFQGVQQHSVEERWEYGGWRVLFEMQEIFIFEKIVMDASPTSPKRYLGLEFIKAPSSCVFNHIRKPVNLKGLFGKCLKKFSVLQSLGKEKYILHLVFNTRQCGLHYPRAVTCIFQAQQRKNLFVVGATSVKQRNIQPQKTVPAIVLLFGFCLDPFYINGMEHCRVTAVSQIDLKDCLEADILQNISQKLLSRVLGNLKGLVEVGSL